mmetsp:Transcript_68950/g.159823  ORF Transcript_68950/g.159823 Transcript_68950/m.159823 type:complete len:256 (+) Transcript_68950:288-1055(+)
MGTPVAGVQPSNATVHGGELCGRLRSNIHQHLCFVLDRRRRLRSLDGLVQDSRKASQRALRGRLGRRWVPHVCLALLVGCPGGGLVSVGAWPLLRFRGRSPRRRRSDPDVGTRVPHLGGLLAIPAPGEDVLAGWKVLGHLQAVDDAERDLATIIVTSVIPKTVEARHWRLELGPVALEPTAEPGATARIVAGRDWVLRPHRSGRKGALRCAQGWDWMARGATLQPLPVTDKIQDRPLEALLRQICETLRPTAEPV